jgi:hypothetical protein
MISSGDVDLRGLAGSRCDRVDAEPFIHPVSALAARPFTAALPSVEIARRIAESAASTSGSTSLSAAPMCPTQDQAPHAPPSLLVLEPVIAPRKQDE